MSSSFEIDFAAENRNLFIKRMRVALYFMAVPLVLSFAVVDYFFHPELLKEFLIVRLMVIPTAFVLYNSYRLRSVLDRYYAAPAYLFTLFLSSINTYMAWRTGGENSPYYAGLNLVGVAAFGFLPWTLKQQLKAAVILYCPYFLVVAFAQHTIAINFFVPHVAFLLSSAFMGSINTYLNDQLRQAECRSRGLLQKQVKIQEKIIDQKTNEGVYLEKLTNQFSPQVVDAIKKSEIQIEKRQRREISCVFIDVENSSSRSSKLDHADYTEVLSDFFSNCVDTFLKYDVTVGTFLGDGILAFVNAPKLCADHQKIAIQASLAILRDHAQRREYYRQKWRTEFNIRIGINTGFASVGFFPTFKRGTYTAIGEPVNLASRLCGQAEANSICVTKTLLRNLGPTDERINVKFQETNSNIKGFENEPFELYSISPILDTNQSKVDACPLCQSAMSVGADLGDSLLIRCSSCQYSDIVSRQQFSAQLAS